MKSHLITRLSLIAIVLAVVLQPSSQHQYQGPTGNPSFKGNIDSGSSLTPRPRPILSSTPTPPPTLESAAPVIDSLAPTSESEPPTASSPSVRPVAELPVKDGRVIYPYKAFGTVSAQAATWHPAKIQLPSPTETTGPNAVIAVIDSGYALSHTAFTGRWKTNPGEIGVTALEGPAPNCTSRGLALNKSCNNLDNDGNGYPSDWRGWNFVAGSNSPQAGTTNSASTSAFHGTFVAGLIGGVTTNGMGGIAPKSIMMPLQALDDDGNGTTDTVADAVRYAADNGADVINMSLGSSYDDPYLREQIAYAISRGIVVVAASGNDGCECVAYPANYPEVIAVGASDQGDNKASFSNYGANLDLVAPGVDMCAAYWSAANPTTSYACGGAGTSFSAPLVAATVALTLALGTHTVNLAGQDVILGVDRLAGMGSSIFSSLYGYGRLNVTKAFVAANSELISLAAEPVLRFHCPGDVVNCTIRTLDSAGYMTLVSSKFPVHAGGEYVYWAPQVGSLTAGVKQIQTVGSTLVQTYFFTIQ